MIAARFPTRAAAAAGADSAAALVEFLRTARVSRLANGLTVAVVPNRRAPIVSTALWYRVGTRHEPPAWGGIAHFLEHMMFKGTERFGPGEIDRLTQTLGGSNNAFTSHDATAYHFDFAADRWQQALALEADRMTGLCIREADVDSERQVIVEEIAMYEDDPWDALEMAAHAAYFGDHPYGRPVLGTRETLAAIDARALAAFQSERYVPANAVLVVAGDVGDDAEAAVAEHFGGLGSIPAPAAPVEPYEPGPGLRRLERRHGEVPRLMLILPAPASSEPEHAVLKLGLTALGHGRASRLQRRLVEEGELCAFVSADVSESPGASVTVLELELLPGVEPERVEGELRTALAELAAQPFTAAELERARRIYLADWVFGHEAVHPQALTVGAALALFDREHPALQLATVLGADADATTAVAAAALRPEAGGLVAWSLPAS